MLIFSVLFGLSTALCWGTCDYIGGTASRRVGAYGMTLGTISGGLLLLLPLALLFNEAPIDSSSWLWSMLAGAFDAVGILFLYLAMTSGRLSLAAPVSALTTAALPVAFGMMTQGIPAANVIIGLLLALAAVWLVSQSTEPEEQGRIRLADLRLPLLSGSCLGIFLILMHTGSHEALLWPMVAVRCGGVAVLLLCFRAFKVAVPTGGDGLPWRLLALNALLDVGGNGFYIIAAQSGRMDVAAVLSALYPGTTVFLAWLLLKEKIGRQQFAGLFVALGAIVLLAL